MIKFFRKIRQKLLSENKFSKYLIYAIGEIVLVVIGILIAIQINNSYNDKEQRKLEHNYLLALQSEFKDNLKKLNKEINENERRIDAVDSLLPLFDNHMIDSISDEDLSKLFFPIFATTLNYEPSNGVLNDIISSGNLNLFQNQKLREHLASFQSSIGFYKLQEKEANIVKSDLQKQFYKSGSIRNILNAIGGAFEHHSISENSNPKELFSSMEFENQLYDYWLTFKGSNAEQYLGGLRENIEEILQVIDGELKK